jgi:hypothetical protein
MADMKEFSKLRAGIYFTHAKKAERQNQKDANKKLVFKERKGIFETGAAADDALN